jgi:hypothetical protein
VQAAQARDGLLQAVGEQDVHLMDHLLRHSHTKQTSMKLSPYGDKWVQGVAEDREYL